MSRLSMGDLSRVSRRRGKARVTRRARASHAPPCRCGGDGQSARRPCPGRGVRRVHREDEAAGGSWLADTVTRAFEA